MGDFSRRWSSINRALLGAKMDAWNTPEPIGALSVIAIDKPFKIYYHNSTGLRLSDPRNRALWEA